MDEQELYEPVLYSRLLWDAPSQVASRTSSSRLVCQEQCGECLHFREPQTATMYRGKQRELSVVRVCLLEHAPASQLLQHTSLVGGGGDSSGDDGGYDDVA